MRYVTASITKLGYSNPIANMGMVEKSAEVEKFIKVVKGRNLKIAPLKKHNFALQWLGSTMTNFKL